MWKRAKEADSQSNNEIRNRALSQFLSTSFRPFPTPRVRLTRKKSVLALLSVR